MDVKEGVRDSAAGLQGEVEAFVGDAASAAALERALDLAESRWGRLDAMVCNAGILRVEPLLEMSEESWDAVLHLNLRGVFLGVQAAARRMARAGGGSIVCISSIGALRGAPGRAGYGAAKAGVIGLVRAAAIELAPHGIRVNAIAPGAVVTPMGEAVYNQPGMREKYLREVPLGRLGEPRDIGAAVRFLVSDASSWITGQVLSVNGGAYL